MTTERDARVTRAYRVVGRVQGVGFRWWTRGVAEELGLGGTVRNLPDGSVEVWACGASPALVALEERLRRGPPLARVQAVEEIPAERLGRPEEFQILP